MSEDLNRIVDKPYIEAPDSDGRPDSELADIWWMNHLKREMSIIVALFTGQYKSLLTCRSCKYESARFEPFSFLQLPLPEDDKVAVSLVLYPLRDDEEPMKYSVRVRHDGALSDVLFSLAKVLYADSLAEENGEAVSGEHNLANDKDEDELDPELEAKYKDIARNLAVVDLRDGYIFKIAPVRLTHVPVVNAIEVHEMYSHRSLVSFCFCFLRTRGRFQICRIRTQENFQLSKCISWSPSQKTRTLLSVLNESSNLLARSSKWRPSGRRRWKAIQLLRMVLMMKRKRATKPQAMIPTMRIIPRRMSTQWR